MLLTSTSKKSLIAALLTLSVALPLSAAFAADQGDRPMGPPPEAFTACENMAENDACSVTTPDGDTLQGSCVMPSQGEQSSLLCAIEGGGPQGGRPPKGQKM